MIIDEKGREILLRPIGVLEQLRLFKALGSELSENRAYFGLAKLAAGVAAIGAVPVPFPINEASIEAILERLGDEGVEAVGAALAESDDAEIVNEAGN